MLIIYYVYTHCTLRSTGSEATNEEFSRMLQQCCGTGLYFQFVADSNSCMQTRHGLALTLTLMTFRCFSTSWPPPGSQSTKDLTACTDKWALNEGNNRPSQQLARRQVNAQTSEMVRPHAAHHWLLEETYYFEFWSFLFIRGWSIPGCGLESIP
jgi:hypothetical protein